MNIQTVIIVFLILIIVGFGGYTYMSKTSPSSTLGLDSKDKNAPSPSTMSEERSVDSEINTNSQPSYDVLEKMDTKASDGRRNLYFHTPESAQKAGVKKYTSGPCKGYYQGEEWWCAGK